MRTGRFRDFSHGGFPPGLHSSSVWCLGMVVCGRVVDLVEGVELVLGGETVGEDAVQKCKGWMNTARAVPLQNACWWLPASRNPS